MEIISHRGFWTDAREKNRPEAFRRSFEHGFGVETDVRDRLGELVISHDCPTGGEMLFQEFLALYSQYQRPGSLALNVKADGLQGEILRLLKAHEITRYFLFDCSVPDLLKTAHAGLVFYTRESELEPQPLSLYERAAGVWMDCFESDWIHASHVTEHLERGKKVCLVSPELHRRPHRAVWERWREIAPAAGSRLALCTDYPQEAKEFFDVF